MSAGENNQKKENLNPFISAQMQLKGACDKLGLDPVVYDLLKQPERVLEVTIPVRMDDGSTRVFTGYRSIHNSSMGPSKGGVRFHQNVTRDEVMALSIWMTIKCTLAGLPYGGGKGGITVDPSELSRNELERLARGYIRAIHMIVGEQLDVPAPDVNTNAQVMAWMVDEYSKITGKLSLGVVTGKPLELGGSKGRTSATGFGVSFTLKYAAKTLNMDITKMKIAVQGFGNVGSYTCLGAHNLGAKIVAIAEYNGVIYNEDGIDIPALMQHFSTAKDITTFPGVKLIDIAEFWALDVDALMPCALENAITASVAETIRAKIICEGANGPTTGEADKILEDKGVFVVPDILANVGGVTVSYFEWVQNSYNYYWSEKEVAEKHEIAMANAFDAAYNASKEYNVPLRQAAFLHAIKSLAVTMKLRGWY
ncbi:glutamate dehydrogenase [Holotrichia oblita]|nr:glutamate dehydrogenase [Holotrichia oblita]